MENTVHNTQTELAILQNLIIKQEAIIKKLKTEISLLRAESHFLQVEKKLQHDSTMPEVTMHEIELLKQLVEDHRKALVAKEIERHEIEQRLFKCNSMS